MQDRLTDHSALVVRLDLAPSEALDVQDPTIADPAAALF